MPRIIVLLTALISLCGADEAEDRWPLIFAAGEGDAAAVERLLAAGADVHQLSADGETALHVSAIKGDLRTAQLLLDAGADVERALRRARLRHDWDPAEADGEPRAAEDASRDR